MAAEIEDALSPTPTPTPGRMQQLYHGTASIHLPSIMRRGLIPGGAARGEGPDGVVYLTDTNAIGCARLAVHRENHQRNYRSRVNIFPVVLEIDADGLDPDKLHPFQRPSTGTIGNCEHLGTVPVDLIERVALIDPAKAPHLYEMAWESQVARGFMEKAGASEGSYNAVCLELRDLTRWIFGEAPANFAGPPARERAGIAMVERQGASNAAFAARVGALLERRSP